MNTHRISIDIGDNEFLQEQPDGLFASTALPPGFPVRADERYLAALNLHQATGHSDLCVICQEAGKVSQLLFQHAHEAVLITETIDPRTPTQHAADEDDKETADTRKADFPS